MGRLCIGLRVRQRGRLRRRNLLHLLYVFDWQAHLTTLLSSESKLFGSCQTVNFVVGRKSAGSYLGKSDTAIDDDLERAGSTDHQLDVFDTSVPKSISRTESTGFVVSSSAILDLNLHGRLLDYSNGYSNNS